MIVSGSIKDSTGEPLMGANVYATVSTGDKVGGTSDFDGNYNIDFTEKEITTPITISYLGFETKTFEPSQLKNANIVLKESTEALDEVVVTAKKKDKNEKSSSDFNKPVSKKGIDKNNLIGIISIGAGVLALTVLFISINRK